MDAARSTGYHPRLSMILPLAQVPIFVFTAYTLRQLCMDDQYKQKLQSGGVLWFKDLTVPDPTWLSPMILGVVHLINFNLNPNFNKTVVSGVVKATSPKQVLLRVVFLGLACLSMPVAANVPMAINIYWMTSSMFSILQHLLIRNRGIRLFLSRVPR